MTHALKRIDWLAVTFGALFGLWLAADRYVGFYLGFSLPISIGLIGSTFCLIGLALLAFQDRRAALISVAVGLVFVGVMDQLWKYAIHPTDQFKLAAVVLLFASPLLAGLGLFLLWRNWRHA